MPPFPLSSTAATIAAMATPQAPGKDLGRKVAAGFLERADALEARGLPGDAQRLRAIARRLSS